MSSLSLFELKYKNYSDSKLNFTPYFVERPKRTVLNSNLNFTPYFVERPKRISLNPNLNFSFSLPSDLLLRTKNTFNTATQPASPAAGRAPIVSPLVVSGATSIGGVAGCTRQAFSSLNKVFGMEHPAALNALGLTAAFSIVSGGLNITNGIQEIKITRKVSDSAGNRLACLKVVTGGVGATSAVVSLSARVLSLAMLLPICYKIISPTMVRVLGTASSVLLPIGLFFIAMSLGIKLDEYRQFRQQLNKILKDPALDSIKALEYLKQLVSVTPEEKAKILTALNCDEVYRAATPDRQAKQAAKHEKRWLQRKEACFKRVLGGECLQLVRQKESAEADAVIKAIRQSSNEKMILTSISLFLACTAFSVTIASFALTGPAAVIALTATGFATGFGVMLLDGYALIQAFKQGSPGRFDKLWLFLSTVLAITAVSLVFFFSTSIIPLIVAGLVGAVWMGIDIAVWYWLKKKQEAQKSISP